MKTLGIVGGIGPESTIDYYRAIFEHHRQLRRDDAAPQMLINSIDVGRLIALMNASRLDEVTRILLQAITQLANGGADFAIIAANTPHIVFDALKLQSPIPLLSIVEATCDEAQRRQRRRPLLFGTRFTMFGTFYPEVFQRRNITLVTPSPSEQETIHAIYLGELLHGIFKDESRQTLLDILRSIRGRESVDSLILAGTELPLGFSPNIRLGC